MKGCCELLLSSVGRVCTLRGARFYKLPNTIVSVACYLASKRVQVLLLYGIQDVSSHMCLLTSQIGRVKAFSQRCEESCESM